MAYRLFSYKSSQISYYRFGTGPRPVFCFHGFGEQACIYAFLEKYADSQYSFFSLDLPFHGKTDWNEGLVFSHLDLLNIIEGILKLENDHWPTSSENLSLLGFSLGGRIALSFYQSQPALVDKVVLLAPDGLIVNPWYWFATQTFIGNRLFASTMKHPQWFFALLRVLNRLRLVNPSVYKFVNYYIGDSEARRLLYSRWTSLRKLRPSLSRIKSLIQRHATPVRLIYGKHDRIILPKRGENFRSGIETHCELTILDAGHQVLQEKHAAQIMNALLH